MKRKVTITALLTTKSEDSEETIESRYEGTASEKDGKYLLVYDEEENEGRSHLLISKERADIRRNGLVKSRLILERGLVHNCEYSTPYGIADMMVATGFYSFSVGEDGGTLRAEYDISIAGTFLSSSKMILSFKYER